MVRGAPRNWLPRVGPKGGRTEGVEEVEARHDSDQGKGKSRKQVGILPYIKGVTERLQRTFTKHIRLYLKAGFTVRDAVGSPKDPLEKYEQCEVIYE